MEVLEHIKPPVVTVRENQRGSGSITVGPMEFYEPETVPFPLGDIDNYRVAIMGTRPDGSQYKTVDLDMPSTGQNSVSVNGIVGPDDTFSWIIAPGVPGGLYGRALPYPETPLAGHHYEWQWSDSQTSGPVTSLPISFKDPECPWLDMPFDVSVTVNLVRDSDNAIICTETGRVTGGDTPIENGCLDWWWNVNSFFWKSPDTENGAAIDAAEVPDLWKLLVVLVPYKICPGEEFGIRSSDQISFAGIQDGEGTLLLTNETLTPEGDYTYTAKLYYDPPPWQTGFLGGMFRFVPANVPPGISYYDQYTYFLPKDECSPLENILELELSTPVACPDDEIEILSNYTLEYCEFGGGALQLTFVQTVGDRYLYKVTVPDGIAYSGAWRITAYTNDTEADIGRAEAWLQISSECFDVPPPDPSEFDVTLSAYSGCPGNTITITATAPVESARFQPFDTVMPLNSLGNNQYQITIPAGIDTPSDYYQIEFKTSEILPDPLRRIGFSIGSECFNEPPDECIPPLPDICISSLSEIHLEPVPSAEFPNCTTTLRLELYTPQNGWEVVKTGIVANTPYTITATVTTGLKARFISDDDTVGAEVEVTDFCCDGGGDDPDEQNPPATPSAPTVDPDCEDEEIIVTSPSFSTIPGAFTKHIELQRRTLPAGPWETVNIFDSSTSWVDDNVQGGNKYEYRARACNAAGCSDWSNISTISLESQTLQIAITKPAPNATVSGRQVIEFTLTDPTADYDPCNPPEPLPSCIEDDTLDLKITINGVEIPNPQLISGTARNGTYRAVWDTKNYFNAPGQTLAIIARGTDCCFKRAEQTVDVQNTIHSGIGYVHIAWERQLPAGLQYKRGHVSMTQNPLHDQLYRQYWVLSAVGADVTTDFSTDDDHEAAFNALTRIALTRYNDHNGIENVGTSFTLEKGGKSLHWVQRWIPRQTIAYYETGMDMVQKLRTVKTGETFVFATSTTNAKAFRFKENSLTELADFSEHDAESAVDAAILGDKIYVVADPDRLILIDTDAADETLDMTPRGEHRDAYAVETTFGTIIALFTGDGETVAYDMSFSSPRRLWTLDFEADVVYGIENGLILTSGTKYYATRSKSTAPTLMFTFPHNVTALDEYRVGLDDGSVWGINPATGLWHSEVGAAGQAVSAVGHWGDGTINIYGVSARGTTELLEYGETGWSSGRTIEAPDGLGTTIDSITALHEHNTSKPSGGDQQGVISSSQLLIGTGDNGVMAVISSSTLDASTGAMLVSKRGQVALTPFWDVIPINNKN